MPKQQETRQQYYAARKEKMIRNSGIGPIFKDRTLEDIKEKKSLYKELKRYLDSWEDVSER